VAIWAAKYIGDQLPLKKNEIYKVRIFYDYEEDYIYLIIVDYNNIRRIYDGVNEFKKEWAVTEDTDKNIVFYCCNCKKRFEIKSRDEFLIEYKYRPFDHKIMIPSYGVKCPQCENIRYLGFDPKDLLEGFEDCNWGDGKVVFNRDDWVERFKMPIKKVEESY
jgi:hypothetical protein